MYKRILPQEISEVRSAIAADEATHIYGRGIAFNSESQKLGFFIEIIEERALDNADMRDIVSTFNHDMNIVLGRTTNQTLTYSIDQRGLNYDVLPLDTQTIRDLVLAPIARRDITGSSFIFRTNKNDEYWERRDGKVIRYVKKIDTVLEFGPVTLQAYRDTSTDLEKRSFDDFIKETREQENHFRADYAKRTMTFLK